MYRYTFIVTVDNARLRKSVNARDSREAKRLLETMYPYAQSIEIIS